MLRDCRFVVQPAGRARVVKEKKKNVHAYISGYISSIPEINAEFSTSIVVDYDPYQHPYFFSRDDGREVRSADFVDMDCGPTGMGMEVVAILSLDLDPQWS